MQESNGTSFIPKRNPVKKVRQASARPVFIGTLLVRAFFFAVLIATVVIFIYNNQLKSKLNTEVSNLNNAIATFSEVDMQKVLDANNRLKQANDRIQHTVSISSIFEALEVATIQTVQIERLELNRQDDTEIKIAAKMKTGTFDSIIFQRGVLERSDKLIVSDIEDLVLNSQSTDVQGAVNDNIESINFSANLSILSESVPHRVVSGDQFRSSVPQASRPVNENGVQEDVQSETETASEAGAETSSESGTEEAIQTGEQSSNQDGV